MKICKPFKTATTASITQGFIPGVHLANDFASSYGTPLVAPFNCKIAVITGADQLDGTEFEVQRGCGIRMVSTEDPTLSCVYWHCEPFFPVEMGDIMLQGQVVAFMGNTGFVESNGVYVPIIDRNKYPFYGTHAHITIGTETEYMDYSKLIDWTIPVNYDLLTSISNTIRNITNFLSKK